MLGKLLNFRRRTKSKYVDDKAVEDFTRVLDQVFSDPEKAVEHLDELRMAPPLILSRNIS